MTRLLSCFSLIAALLAAAPAMAHGLVVFASIEAETLVVEAKFSNGKRPKAGDVRVFDGADQLLHETAVGEGGITRIPLDLIAAGVETGVKVEVETGVGHSDYWILTPDDISAQRGSVTN